MASARSAWGIDIGNRALKAVRLVRDGDRLRVDDVEVLEHEQILSSAGDNREALIQTALAGFVQRHNTKGSVVGISVSGQSSFARFIKLPPVEPKKIPEIVKFEAIQQIPFSLDEVEWAYQLFQDPESPELEVGLFAMRKELINAQIKEFTDLEMNVQVVQTSPLSVYNAMQYDGQLGEGATMIVDCGAENTDLIITHGESVWLRTISIGGNNFTEALTKSFKLNFPKAEDLKRNAASSKYQRQIFQAMRPVFADFVSEIQRSLGFYGTVHRDAKIERVIALGSTFRLPTLQKYLQQNLQIDVKRLDGFSGGAPSDGRLAAMLSENVGSLATAYGLAVQAMGDAKITSSLLPEQIRKAKIWKEKTPWFALAAACFVLGTVGGPAARWYLDKQQYDAQSNTRDVIDKTIKTGEQMERDYGEVQQQGDPDRKRIQYVSGFITGHGLWNSLYQDLTSNELIPSLSDQSGEQLKKTQRTQRRQIVLHAMNSSYQAKMTQILSMTPGEFRQLTVDQSGNVTMQSTAASNVPMPGADNPGAATPGATPAAPTTPLPPGAENARGFLITMRCTTPNAQGSSFIQQTLVDNMMRKLGLDAVQPPAPPPGSNNNSAPPGKPTKPYYIAKAAIVSSTKLGIDTNLQGLMKNGATGAGGAIGMMRPVVNYGAAGPGDEPGTPGLPGRRAYIPPRPPGGVGTTAVGPNGQSLPPAFPDPLTSEDMSEDASVTVLIAVVLDPPVAPPAPANGARASAQ